MTWIAAEGFAKRPLVVVEDHLYHMTELLERLGGPAPLHDQLTAVCLDRPGPDTTRTTAGWLATWPELQVMAAVEPAAGALAGTRTPAGTWAPAGTGTPSETGAAPGTGAPPGTAAPAEYEASPGDVPAASARFRPLPPAAFASAHRLCQALAGALRPGGLLLQDIQLETLAFIPADRWWESIYLASTVRGMFAERPPACRFFSNKRGYEATFGRDLLDAGFDPREVIDKGELERAVVPTLRGFLDRSFPLLLRLAAPGRPPRSLRVAGAGAGTGSGDREDVEGTADLVLWSAGDGAWELGGRALAAAPGEPARRRRALKPGSQEAATWRSLLEDRLAGGAAGGLPVLDVGRRLAQAGAGKAELTNVAARHLHTLRGRLADPGDIVTAQHHYSLCERLTVGLALEAKGARQAGSAGRATGP
jgi:hypothetical protein